MTDRSIVEIAREAAKAAAELLANVDVRTADVRAKGNANDLVTEWDTKSEARIRAVLRAHSPWPILGEEGGEGEGEGDHRWIVDPIDGTVNFAHGLPLWSIVIACERTRDHALEGRGLRGGEGEGVGQAKSGGRENVIVAGVVAAPQLGWHFEAILGGGATQNGAAIRVSERTTIAEALLVTGFPYDRATNPANNFAEWEHLQRRAGACRRLGCASLDLCLVARGNFEGYWERGLKAWDIAAGGLIVAEAGGRVTSTRGSGFDPHSGDVCATNGAIHEELIRELAAARRGD